MSDEPFFTAEDFDYLEARDKVRRENLTIYVKETVAELANAKVETLLKSHDQMEVALKIVTEQNRIMKEALEKYEKLSVRYDCPQNTAHLKPGDFVKIECGEIAREALTKVAALGKELEK